MSEQNAERVIRAMYDRWNADGTGAMAERFFDAEVEYHDDARWPGGGAHHGRRTVIARFDEVIEVLGITEATVERVIDRGEELAWVVRASGRSPGENVPNDHRWGYVGRIAGEKLVFFRAYYDPAEALKAVGLTE